MNKKTIRRLGPSLHAHRAHPTEYRRMLADTQARAWLRLGGQWASEFPVDIEVAGIYAARTGGREIEL